MSSLNTIRLKNRPTLTNKLLDLSSRKMENISRIGLPNSTKIDFLFFGRGGFCILTFLGREGGWKRPKNVSWEKSIYKSSLISCPMNLSASHILMVLSLSHGKTS